MTQNKPAAKGASKRNSKPTTKNKYVDKYESKARETWEDRRKQLISKLPANSSLPVAAPSKKPARKKPTVGDSSDSTL